MPYAVILNVYDLPQQESMNNNLRSMGLGFFHTGVQFHNHEYSFSDQGVSQTRPLLPEFGAAREQIHITSYEGTLDSFLGIVEGLQQSTFRPGRYHPLRCNCNHFSDALLQQVCGARVPEWVNRAANVGSGLSLGGVSSSSAGVSSFAAPGRTKPPSLPFSCTDDNADEAAPPTNSSSVVSSVFSWLFGSSSSAESTPVVQKTMNKDPKQKKKLSDKQKAMLDKLKSANK